MPATDFDCAIVGGGPVGATLACAVARSGARTALLDGGAAHALPPGYDERVYALALSSRHLLEAYRVWPRLAGLATPIERIDIAQLRFPGRTVLDAADEGVEAFGYVVTARDLGEALYRQLAECGVTVLRPARVVGLGRRRHAVALAVERDGKSHTVTARIAVAADGSRSTLRELAGIGARWIDYRQHALVARFVPGVAHAHTAYERFTADGPLALLPLPAACALVWSMRPERAERLADADDAVFTRAVQAAFGPSLGRLRPAGWRRSYPLRGLRVERLVRGRVALAGNAAHAIHPIAAQGLNLGLRDVGRLAELVGDACAHGEDPGDSRRLALYAAERSREHRRAIAFTDGLLSLFANRALPLRLARSLGLAGFDALAPLKHRFALATMGLAGRAWSDG